MGVTTLLMTSKRRSRNHPRPMRGISVPDDATEKLVAFKKRSDSHEGRWTSSASPSVKSLRRYELAQSLRIADVVVVAPGSISITSSGKLKSARVE